MQSREEILRGALAKAGTPKGAEIKFLKKDADVTAVFVNGEYFNTFDFSLNHFTDTQPEQEREEPVYFKTVIKVSIFRKDLRDNPHYKGAELNLPATPDEIQDALDRARISLNNEYEISNFAWKDNYLDSDLTQAASIEELNFLARRLCRMDETESLAFEGCMAMRDYYFTVKDLINITYNLEECHVIYEGINDEQLGRFYAENGFVVELTGIPEKAWEFLDFEKIGKSFRESEKGVFLDGCYVVNNKADFQEIYDGITLPEQPPQINSVFSILISKAPRGGEPTDEQGKWLHLPATGEQTETLLKELGAGSFNECVFYELKTKIPNMHEVFTDLSQLNALNTLAAHITELSLNAALPQYKAILEHTGCDSIEKAIDYSENLHCFDFYPDIFSYSDYGKYVFDKKAIVKPTDPIYKFFDMKAYGWDQMERNRASNTNYGCILKNGDELVFRQSENRQSKLDNMEM